jgi:hypothetical protein
MSQTANPFGLRPVHHPSGVIRPVVGTIASGYASNILQNQPVAIAADGTITAAAVGARFVGVFQGCEYTDSEGRRRVTNRWTANLVATDIVAYYTRDPSIVYEIQANGTIAQADVGSQADFTTITAGSLVTGISAIALDQATLTNAGNASLRILGFGTQADNAVGDSYTIVRVQISEHQNVADRAAY